MPRKESSVHLGSPRSLLLQSYHLQLPNVLRPYQRSPQHTLNGGCRFLDQSRFCRPLLTDYLDNSGTVSDICEYETSFISVLLYPSHDGHCLTDIHCRPTRHNGEFSSAPALIQPLYLILSFLLSSCSVYRCFLLLLFIAAFLSQLFLFALLYRLTGCPQNHGSTL